MRQDDIANFLIPLVMQDYVANFLIPLVMQDDIANFLTPLVMQDDVANCLIPLLFSELYSSQPVSQQMLHQSSPEQRGTWQGRVLGD